MSAAAAPALKHSGDTGERGSTETVEGFYLCVTKSAPTVRQSAKGDGEGVGERLGGAMAGRLNGGILLLFCGDVHTHTHEYMKLYQGIPPRSNTTHHYLITPVPKDRRGDVEKEVAKRLDRK